MSEQTGLQTPGLNPLKLVNPLNADNTLQMSRDDTSAPGTGVVLVTVTDLHTVLFELQPEQAREVRDWLNQRMPP